MEFLSPESMKDSTEAYGQFGEIGAFADHDFESVVFEAINGPMAGSAKKRCAASLVVRDDTPF